MAPKTLLPLPSRKHRIGGWSVDLGFVKSVQSGTENILNDIDEVPSLEQVEAVLLAANVQFLRSWQTAGGEIPSGGVESKEPACPPERLVMSFDNLALGARFSYIDSDRVWIKLSNDGCGTVAEYDSEMIKHEKWIGQSICSAKESDDENLMVVFVESNTDIKKSFNDIWDSVTDFLTQDQIDRIERIHKKDFEKMEDDRFEPK